MSNVRAFDPSERSPFRAFQTAPLVVASITTLRPYFEHSSLSADRQEADYRNPASQSAAFTMLEGDVIRAPTKLGAFSPRLAPMLHDIAQPTMWAARGGGAPGMLAPAR